MITPSCAARPVPTMIAIGVANPSAQGQAMISTATAAVNASSAPWPVTSQPTSVSAAMPIATGTNTAGHAVGEALHVGADCPAPFRRAG